MRVFFTGGSGNAGRMVIAVLAAMGHRVVNFDLRPLGMAGVPDLIGDVTDAGQVAAALGAHAGVEELSAGPPQDFDAIVHFAAMPRPLLVPDVEMFRVNAFGTEVVLRAAERARVGKVIVASSESIYGMCYADGTMQPEQLPLDETTALTPTDSYGLSKEVNEASARAMQRRSGADVLCLRMALVLAPADYARFPEDFANPGPRRRGSFAYIDGRDLGHVVHLALVAQGVGFQILNVAHAESCLPIPTQDLTRRFFDGVPQTRALVAHESLVCTQKLRRMLGYSDRHGWRDHVSPTA
ncbi:NAD(P)-dependent oxidoreductase [Tabrizicola sp.]|uniref:NAD-dependent epimerase/dehydratase family protein n=1 Tax=Tabrizicola sp. TaxID=2005166 RepID=UPI00286C5157|nr:NAD(P)-dependent oxidoreductase [Tabrizicola sp.]